MDEKDLSLLAEYSKLNNELVNARRELARVNSTLGDRERFLSRILSMSPSVVYLFDMAASRYSYASRPLASLLGFDGERPLDPIDGMEGIEKHRAAFTSAADGEVRSFEFSARGAEGSTMWLQMKETVFSRNDDGSIRSILGVLNDITLQKEREECLRKESAIDPLTGLHNRRSFEASAATLLHASNLRGIPCALLFFDLDGFKSINDRHGHAQGDAALQLFAEGLKKTFRTSDIISRFGGDEFVVFTGDMEEANLPPLLDRLRKVIDSLHAKEQRPWSLGWSLGASFFVPGGKPDLEKMIMTADEKMYINKAKVYEHS
jgi:diguanylate cyclase (GGDEF)-like protein